jgi:hypothetical protein
MGRSRHVETARKCVFHGGSETAEPHFGGFEKDLDLSGKFHKTNRFPIDAEQEKKDVSTLILDQEASATMLVDDLDVENGLDDWNGSGTMISPPTRPAPDDPAEQAEPPNRARVLGRLLAMADTYRKAGSVRQAVEMYFELIREHAESSQALEAEDRLLDVARYYEKGGELRQARGIYEQLL